MKIFRADIYNDFKLTKNIICSFVRDVCTVGKLLLNLHSETRSNNQENNIRQ